MILFDLVDEVGKDGVFVRVVGCLLSGYVRLVYGLRLYVGIVFLRVRLVFWVGGFGSKMCEC